MPSMKTRIQHKRDTASNWEKVASTFIPNDGEIILYDTKSGTVRMKIGDGVKPVGSLPFVDEAWKNLILAGVEDADTWRTIQVDGEDVVIGNDGKKINLISASSKVYIAAEESDTGDIDVVIDASDIRVRQKEKHRGDTNDNINYPLLFSDEGKSGTRDTQTFKNTLLTFNPHQNRLLIGAAAIEDGKFIAPSIQLGGTVTTDDEGNIITDPSSGTVIEVKDDGSISGNFSGNFTGTLEGAAGDIAGAKTLVDADGELVEAGSEKAPVYFKDGVPVAISDLGEAAWKNVLENNEGFADSEELPTAKTVSAYVESKDYATKSELKSGSYKVKEAEKAEEATHSQTTSGFDETALGIIKGTTVDNATKASEADHAAEAGHAEEADHALNADDALRAVDAQNAQDADHADEADYADEAGHAGTADLATKATEADSAKQADKTIGTLTIGETAPVKFNGSSNKEVPDASTTEYGVTKLSSISSDSESLAATPKLVKDTADAILADFEIDYNKSVISMHVDGNEVEYQTADGEWHKITHVGHENVTFSIGDSEFPGLTKLYATTGTWEDGSLTVKAVSEELDKKVNYDDIVITDNTLRFDATLINK